MHSQYIHRSEGLYVLDTTPRKSDSTNDSYAARLDHEWCTRSSESTFEYCSASLWPLDFFQYFNADQSRQVVS